MPANVHLTTPLVWMSTGTLMVLDVILTLVMRRYIRHEHIQQMRWLLIAISGFFFLLVWTAAMLWAWDWFYIYIFPPWARYLLPPIFGIGYTLLAAGMVWLSLKLPGSSVVTWCLLGGLEGLLSHIYAIYGLGAASKPPIMQGSDPFVVLIFAIFELSFYWSLLLLASRLLWKGFKRKSD